MNGLYPIIRRVRRPLLPTEAAADAKPVVSGQLALVVVEPPPAVPLVAPSQIQPNRKDKRGKAAASEPAKQAR